MTSGTKSMLAKTTHILIVDDHPIVRQGYRQLLMTQPDLQICGEAASEAEALQLARELEPELVIIDITLDSGNGIDLIKRLASRGTKVRMLAASAHDESLYAERALRAGARGFINKKAAIDHLITAVRTVLDGDVYLSERMRQRVLKQLARPGADNGADSVTLLSDRELEAFELIGQGVATREIAKRMHVATKTVDRYRENIKQKLGLQNASELVRHATQWVLQNQ